MDTRGIIGDTGYGLDLPDTQVDDQQMTEEKSMARFSKTKEFKRLKSFIEAKIVWYQRYLPDGRYVGGGRAVGEGELPTPEQWAVASLVVKEFQNILNEYERAEE